MISDKPIQNVSLQEFGCNYEHLDHMIKQTTALSLGCVKGLGLLWSILLGSYIGHPDLSISDWAIKWDLRMGMF